MKRLLISFYRYVRSWFTKISFRDLVENHNAQIVDVRTPAECSSYGCIKNSLKIPLDALRLELGKIDKERPVIVCCGNGLRSGLASQILKRNGFKRVFKAGSYDRLKYELNAVA